MLFLLVYTYRNIFLLRVQTAESLYNVNPDIGLPNMPLHPGVGLCDCSCNDPDGCDKAKCDNTKWTTNCHSVGQNQDDIFQEQCRRIIHNKRKKRSVGELQDDYSENVKPAFSFMEEKVSLTRPDVCMWGQANKAGPNMGRWNHAVLASN